MNPILKHFQEIPDEELKAMVLEIQDLRSTGILLGGKVQACARSLEEAYWMNPHDARQIALEQVNIEAARRWVASSAAEKLLKDLVHALDNAFISSWQSTHAWQKQVEDARDFLGDLSE